MGIKSTYTINNHLRLTPYLQSVVLYILEFNRLLTDICIKKGCSLLDCFHDFVSQDGYDYDRRLYKDDIHLSSRGVGILCMWFKHVIYSDVFNPFIL